MNHALLMGGADSIDQWDSRLEKVGPREALRRDELVQRLPVHDLHREEVHACGLLDGVNRDNVRVVQGGEGLRFAAEALKPIRIGRGLGRKQLQRNAAIETRIFRGVYRTHSARAEGVQDPIVQQRATDHRCRG